MTKVLIDFPCLLYRALHTTYELRNEDVPTGIIYGVLEQLRNLSTDPNIQCKNLLIFGDSHRSFRKELFPDYKKSRRDDDPTGHKAIMREQGKFMLDEMLPLLGFPVYRQLGLESDDLLMMASLQASLQEKIIVVTGDQDLFQVLICPQTSVYDPIKKRMTTPHTFHERFGIEVGHWFMVKIIAGCETDNVPGATRVGIRSAIKYINGEIPPHQKVFQQIQQFFSNPENEARNKELVELPHPRTRKMVLRNPRLDSNSMDMLMRYSHQFGFKSYTEDGIRKDAWKRFFLGEKHHA